MYKKIYHPRLAKFLLDYGIPLIVAVGVAIVVFNRAATLGQNKGDISSTFQSLTTGIEDYYNFKTAWKPRIFSNGLAALDILTSKWLIARVNIPMVRNYFELTIASWTAAWFLAICLSFIIFKKRQSLFYIFGTVASLFFGLMPRLQMAVRIYPWDMPALFFFTIFVILFIQKKYWWIFVILPIGMGFKETVFVLCISFLFAELPWKQRIYMLIGSAALCTLSKIAIDLFVHAPYFFTMEISPSKNSMNSLYLIRNLYSLKNVLPYFINAGTLLAFYLVPNRDKNILALKLISIPFVLGNLLFGVLDEYRIWFEMIPFALYALHIATHDEE